MQSARDHRTHQPGRAARGGARRAQRRAACGGRTRRRRCPRRGGARPAAAARDRRRRLGQDQHARASRGPSDRARRRSAAHPAADLLAPRGAGDGAARRAGAGARARPASRGAAGPAVGRHLPRHRRAPAARIRGADRPRRELHHPRPRRCRGPDGHGAQRHRAGDDGAALSAQGHLPLDLLAHRQQLRAACRGAARTRFRGAPNGRPSSSASSARTSKPSRRSRCSTTTTCCSYWAGMVAEPALAAQIGARFDHVLVDEYQDTNLLQAAILRALKPDGRGLTVVGDDAQSIYSFRGATVRNILDFPHQFTQPARVVTLERNYRSTQPILDVSNAVIAAAAERHAKTLWTDKPSAGRPATGAGARRGAAGPLRGRARARAPRRRAGAEVAGRAVPHLEPQRGARTRAGAAQHPLRQVRRPQVSRGRAREGRAGGAALRPEPARAHGGLSGHAADSRHRAGHVPRGCSMRWPRPRTPVPSCRTSSRLPPRRKSGRASRPSMRRCARPRSRGRPTWNSRCSGTCRTWSGCTTTPACAAATSSSSRGWPRAMPPASAS